MKCYFTLILLLTFSTNVVFSATFSTIRGVVKDAQTDEELIGASVWVKEKKTGTTTGLDGSFQLQLNQFPVTLVYSFIGYIQQEITIENSNQTTVRILLKPNAQQLEGVEIQARAVGNTDIGARAIERNALNVMNVVSARTIEISPDMTVANVIQRMSGVVMERDNSGDGQYALLRGMDKRFNYTLVNGVKIPSPDNKNRFVPLDIFPSELLDRLEVTKAITADMEGDGIGGAINMVMKDAPSELQVTANLSTSVNSQFFSRDFQTFNHSAVDRQSPDGKYGLGFPSRIQHFTTKNLRMSERNFPMGLAGGFSVGGRVWKDKLGIMVATSYSNAYRGSTSDVYGNVGSSGSQEVTNRYFSTEQTRLGTHAKFDLRLSQNHKLMWYNAYMDFQNKQVRDAIGGSAQTRTSQTIRMRWNHQSILASTLRGDHHFLNNKLRFNWSVAYGNAFNETPDNATVRLNPAGNGTEASIYTTTAIRRRWEENSDNDKAIYVNLIYTTQIGATKIDWSTGGLFRDKKRESLFYEYTFSPTFTPQVRGIHWNHFDEIKMDLASVSLHDPLNYDASEQITAGYVQAKMRLGKFQTITGLRMEHTKQGYDLKFPIGGNIKPVGFQNYVSWLPNFHARYELNRNTNLRFSYVKAINRPSFFEIVPYTKEFEDYMEVGNPDLRHTVADNFDLRYEYFPRSSEQFMVGLFYKHIKDPIEYRMVETGRGANYMPDNLGNANNLGIEMDATRYFRKLGVKANYTFTHSSIISPKWLLLPNPDPDADRPTIVVDKNQNRQLFGQAAHVANFSLLYRDMENGWNAQLAFSYTSKRLVQISRWHDQDVWQDGFMRLDASIEKKFPKIKLTAFAKASNLLNTPMYLYINPNSSDNHLEGYARRSDGRIERIEHYGINIQIGLKYKL